MIPDGRVEITANSMGFILNELMEKVGSTSEPTLLAEEGYMKFYQLCDPLKTRRYRLDVREDGSCLSLLHAHELARGKYSPPKPIKMVINFGGEPPDFIWSNLSPLFCVSDRVIQFLISSNFTGWATYDVDIINNKEGKLVLGYKGFIISGKECRRDRSRDQIITKPAAKGRNEFDVYKGLNFLIADWDGSDFFWVNTGSKIVSNRVRELFSNEKISNVKLTQLEDVERDVYLDKYDIGNL